MFRCRGKIGCGGKIGAAFVHGDPKSSGSTRRFRQVARYRACCAASRALQGLAVHRIRLALLDCDIVQANSFHQLFERGTYAAGSLMPKRSTSSTCSHAMLSHACRRASAEHRRGCASLLPRDNAVRWTEATDVRAAYLQISFLVPPAGSNLAARHRFKRREWAASPRRRQ